MPTTYPHALRFADNGDQGFAPAHAIYNDLANITFAGLVRYDNASDNMVFSKGELGLGHTALLGAGTGRLDYRVVRASGEYTFRHAPTVPIDSSWAWIFLTFSRSTGVHTRHIGAKGGTLTTVSAGDIGGGSGAVASDAPYALTLGSNGNQVSARILDVAFFGVWDLIMSLAQAQAVNDDLSAAVQPVWAIKPDAGTTTSIASYTGSGPAMTLSGTTTVAGPDTTGGGGSFASYYAAQLRAVGILP